MSARRDSRSRLRSRPHGPSEQSHDVTGLMETRIRGWADGLGSIYEDSCFCFGPPRCYSG